jgi:hypothetical protein
MASPPSHADTAPDPPAKTPPRGWDRLRLAAPLWPTLLVTLLVAVVGVGNAAAPPGETLRDPTPVVTLGVTLGIVASVVLASILLLRRGRPPGAADIVSLGALPVLVGVLLAWVAASGVRWEIGIPGEWTWPYFRSGYLAPSEGPFLYLGGAVLMAGLMAAALGAGVRRGLRDRRERLLLPVVCLGLALGVILMLGRGSRHNLLDLAQPIAVTVAPARGGYYAEAVRVEEMGPYLEHYAEMIDALAVDDLVRGHIANHPAGPVVFHWTVNRLLEASPGLCELLIPEGRRFRREAQGLAARLVNAPGSAGPSQAPTRLSQGEFAGIWGAALLFRLGFWAGLIPLYFLGRMLADAETGLFAVCLAALIPSLHLFGPYGDQLFVPVATWSFLFWLLGVRRKSLAWSAAAGALLCLGLHWSLSLLLAVALVGVGSILVFINERRTPGASWNARGWLRVAAGGLGGFLLAALLPALLFDYDTFKVWRICLSQHADFAALFRRSYLPWLLYNPVELLIFTGVPVTCLLVAQCAADVSRPAGATRPAAIPLMPWAVVGVFAVVNLTGKNLGEIARLWMFLMPFAALGAARWMRRVRRGKGGFAAAMVLAMAAQTFVFKIYLDVFSLTNR